MSERTAEARRKVLASLHHGKPNRASDLPDSKPETLGETMNRVTEETRAKISEAVARELKKKDEDEEVLKPNR